MRGSPILAAIFLLGCLALVFWAGRRNDRFLYLAGFLISLHPFGLVFYVDWRWAIVLLPLALAAIVVHKKRVEGWRDITAWRRLVIYFAYVFYMTLIRAYLDYTSDAPRYLRAAATGFGLAQSTYRYPVQLASFFLTWGALFIGFWFVRERRDVTAVIKGYVDVCTLNALLSFYQMAAYRWGLPWPTQVLTPNVGDIATRSRLGGLSVDLYRVGALGGEPKHLASSLVLAIALISCLELFSRSDNPIRHARLKLVIMLLSVFFTFSTGGWLAIFCVGAYLLAASLRHARWQYLGYVMVALLVLGALAQFLGGLQTMQDLYTARIDDRLSGGLEGLHYQEGRDAAVVEYALANPLDMILGHGTGGIDFWIMDMAYLVEWNTRRSGPVTPAYLFTRLLGDIGLLGIGLLLLAWVPWTNKLQAAGLPAYRQFLIAGGLTLVFASVLSLNAYLLISASMVAYACRAEMPSQAPAADRVGGWQRQQGRPVRPGWNP